MPLHINAMNDPGLDEPISKVADRVEDEKDEEREAEDEDEQTFLDPRCVPLVTQVEPT